MSSQQAIPLLHESTLFFSIFRAYHTREKMSSAICSAFCTNLGNILTNCLKKSIIMVGNEVQDMMLIACEMMREEVLLACRHVRIQPEILWL